MRKETAELPDSAKLSGTESLRARLRECRLDTAMLLKTTLQFLQTELKAVEAGIFLLDERRETLKELWRVRGHGAIEPGGRDDLLWEGGIMLDLLRGAAEWESVESPQSQEARIFLVRIPDVRSGNRTAPDSSQQNVRFQGAPLLRGIGVIEILADARTDIRQLTDAAAELSEWLGFSRLEEQIERQSRQIESFSKLSWLFVTSLRLEDRLRMILEGLQRLFSFDRIRLYLIDKTGTRLVGELEANLRRVIRRIDAENYPVTSEDRRDLVEVLLQSLRQNPWSRLLENPLDEHEKVMYLPLKVQNKEFGVLVVDNLISQVSISEQARQLLESVAGQIALAVDNARLFSEVEQLSLYDALSKLPNRRYFEQRFQEELYRAYRHRQPFAACLMDLDFFKEINDTFGHQMGDQAIHGIGQAILSVIRQSDFAARWGGDEIALILGDTTAQDVAQAAQRIMQAVRGVRLFYPANPPKEIGVTASMGIALYPQDGADMESLMASADRALYEMKYRGRNGFCLSSQAPPDKAAEGPSALLPPPQTANGPS
ncbi:MAG: sensor domain-containing diguanylate cyclase [Elusimicrobia bacterium]|nr:sensor domain-containing diguanylate cyclase [Elusimicrobiota bacterium]